MLFRAAASIALASVLAPTAYAGHRARAENYSVAFSANFLDDLFEYKTDIDASQLFPTKEIKDDIVGKLEASDYKIPDIERECIAFKKVASDVKIYVKPSKMDGSNTRISVDIEGKYVKVESKSINKKYNNLDIDTIYGVYNAKPDKVTIHVPYATAFSLMFG